MLTNNFAYMYTWRNYNGMNGSSNTTYAIPYSVSSMRQGQGYFQVSGFYQLGVTLDVGFGDTEVSESDYVLADGNYDNRKLTCVVQTYSNIGRQLLAMTATFKNEGSSPVTVKELGLYIANSGSQQGQSNVYGLVARSVLETPVTIGVGESYAFTYSVEI